MEVEVKMQRLFSLDALRGLDMLFLCVVQPLVIAVAAAWGVADANLHPFMRQFGHYWGGFTAYDLIMPLFIFMCGAAIPLALPKRLDAEGRPSAAFWKPTFNDTAPTPGVVEMDVTATGEETSRNYEITH